MTSKELESRERDWESVFLPIVLMVTGAIVLAGADFGMVSLDRMKDWWPIAIILVGLADLLPAGARERGQRG